MPAKKIIPAIQGTIGAWTYYVSTMTFDEISQYVSPINDALHKSKSLSDAIQRSITDNYLSIKDYILNQDERFFNAIVLAIYDGNPNWIEVELEIENQEFYNSGFLSLNGEEKIFPVDGQHRVAGIKAALEDNDSLNNEKVPVIFIGHKKTDEGMQKTRRLFSTLNRYAKPVSPKDIIALDEDDIVAITTRYLVENHPLFEKERVIFSLQKGIGESNKKAFTSLIALADCVDELFKYYFNFYKRSQDYKNFLLKFFPDKSTIGVAAFKRFRPSEETIENFINFTMSYWNNVSSLTDIKHYISSTADEPALPYRSREEGGNILFRPIGIVPFVQATINNAKFYSFKEISDIDFTSVIADFEHINFNMNQKPWIHVVWDPHTFTMKTTGNRKLTKLLFLYLSNLDAPERLPSTDLAYIKLHYASFLAFEGDLSDITLEELLNLTI